MLSLPVVWYAVGTRYQDDRTQKRKHSAKHRAGWIKCRHAQCRDKALDQQIDGQQEVAQQAMVRLVVRVHRVRMLLHKVCVLCKRCQRLT